jgi:uncharacterized damage-inducible protein DinB
MDNPIEQLERQREYFLRTVECLQEEDGAFRPTDDAWTLTQQIAHTAQTVDWFVEGAFSDTGFDHNWDGLEEKLSKVNDLKGALEWFNKSYADAIRFLSEQPEAELMKPIADEHIMTGAPRITLVAALADHTAHHRGAISVYARQCGRTPAMPYM